MAAGAERSELSIVITTSAWLRDGRLPEPAKITASMSAARSDLCEVSPIAQRNASTRLDLPQPFGPTTPVKPGSIMKSVGSTNDLKPGRRRRVFEAILDRLLAEAGLLADAGQRFGGILRDPVVLLFEQHVDDREIFPGIVLGDAARQHRARRGLDVERELAEHVTYLAGVDIFRLDLRKHGFVEGRPMRAGHRRKFGDRHLGVAGAARQVRQRYGL